MTVVQAVKLSTIGGIGGLIAVLVLGAVFAIPSGLSSLVLSGVLGVVIVAALLVRAIR